MSISEKAKMIIKDVPKNVKIIAAAKTRSPEEIKEIVGAGIKNIGENYLQESEDIILTLNEDIEWHFIGHLQKNKVKKVVNLFDMIQTVDSFSLCKEIDKRAKSINKFMKILIEVNIASESNKSGVLPEKAENLIKDISFFENIEVLGLMTMGPFVEDGELLRPYFKKAKKLFDSIKVQKIPNINMKYLSMGMSSSYKVAVEEGANMIRLGTILFGERKYN